LIRIRLTPFRKEFVVSPVRGVFSDSYPFRNPQTPLTGLTTNEIRLRAQSHRLLALYPWETPPQRSYSREKGIRNFIKCYRACKPLNGSGFPACGAEGHENGSETRAGKPAPLILQGQMSHFARPSPRPESPRAGLDFPACPGDNALNRRDGHSLCRPITH